MVFAMTVKRIEAGDYQCEHDGVKFTVYRIKEREYRGRALMRANRHGSYTSANYANVMHWAFNLGDGRGSFAGYGSKRQALCTAIKTIERK